MIDVNAGFLRDLFASLRHNLPERLPFVERRALGAALVRVDEPHVVQPQQPEDGGVQVVDVREGRKSLDAGHQLPGL